VRVGRRAVGVDAEGVETVGPGAELLRVPARTVIWAAGVEASPLARRLAEAAGADVDPAGRLVVREDLAVGHCGVASAR
jgi:NADH dehydrogenase